MAALKLAGIVLSGLAVAGAVLLAGPERIPTVDVATSSCAIAPAGGPHPGMAWVPAGSFTMGAEYAYREEGPAHEEQLAGFWMDQAEVTNAEFAQFVAATSYVTLAERGISDPATGAARPGSAVFKPVFNDGELDPFTNWWQFVAEANWRQPEGPGSSIAGLERHPVVHVAYEDALAYAQWKGHSLPTEEQFEYAAQSSARRDAGGDFTSNTWQGFFPFQNDPLDGYTGTAPAGCYTANALGLYDLIGNVWEWTASPYYLGHDFAAKDSYPEGFDPDQPDEAVAVIKGGSYLCAPNYCMRYRPEARQGQSKGLGASHIGFRTVLMAPGP
jgi:formylglycine-generating enzyme required for sulfatase activity